MIAKCSAGEPASFVVLSRSGGRCGKSDATRSGRAAKSGRRFAGVRTSLREMSGCWCCWAWAREEEAPEPGLVPREVTMERMRASSSGVAWYEPVGCDLGMDRRGDEHVSARGL